MSSGNYVDVPTLGVTNIIGAINSPWSLVEGRFNTSLDRAKEMLTLLVGEDGQSGYLGDMNNAIVAAPTVTIAPSGVNTSLTPVQSGEVMPVFDGSQLAPYPTIDPNLAPSVSGVPIPVFDDTQLAPYPNIDPNLAPLTSGLTTPVFDDSKIVAVPTATYTLEPLDVVPTIDTSGLVVADVTAPAAFTFSVTDEALPQDIYPHILARMLNDLQSGATGLDPIVEQAIFDRARFKQSTERNLAYQKLNDDIAARGFMLPSGPLISALTDFAAEGLRLDTEITNNIITTQADLAQKNSQFMMTQAVALEQLIRQTNDKTNDRALEEAKTNATLIIQDYSERIKAYVATWEGKKAYVSAMAENLKAVLESNKGKIDTFKAQYEALKTQIEAATSTNKGVTDVYLGKIQGYGEAERAIAAQNASMVDILKVRVEAATSTNKNITDVFLGEVQAYGEVEKAVASKNSSMVDILKTTVDAASSTNKSVTDVFLGKVQAYGEAEKAVASRNSSLVEILKAQVMAAEIDIKAAIAQAEESIKGYTAEQGLKGQVTNDMAKIAAQTVASMMAAVNASASLGYSGSASESVSVSNSAQISESHSYEHDPLA